jgi:hypothetical protein
MANVNDVYRQCGKLVEKYDVVTRNPAPGPCCDFDQLAASCKTRAFCVVKILQAIG